MTFELSMGFIVMFLALILHLVATILLVRVVRPFDPLIKSSPYKFVSITLLLTNVIFFTTQITGIGMWASLFFYLGLTANFSDAFYSAFITHTTLGTGLVPQEVGTRVLTPLAAMSGIMTIGWSSAVLIYIVQTYLPHVARHE